ncbi:MAG: mechanosensitive ion channel family protein [Pseudomonadales bacterium]|jgi:small-conductance mechanosensitive channel
MNELIPEADIQSTISWLNMIKAALLVLIGWVVARLASRFFTRFTRFKLNKHQLAIYTRFIFYLLFSLFAITALHQLGFKISVLLGAAGILTVALGFASQTSASNLISGLFLLGEKPFEIGDVLKVDGDTGEVISVDLLSVKLRTFDNLYVRIPNELLIKSKFTNLTKFPIRRIDLVIGVAYRENLQKVIQLLLELTARDARCLEEPQPFCIITGFGSSSVDLQLSVWCRREVFRDLKSELMQAIKQSFDAHGIEIPFPHVSLYSGSQTAPFPVYQVDQPGKETPTPDGQSGV